MVYAINPCANINDYSMSGFGSKLKEYCNIPSLILREQLCRCVARSKVRLSAGARNLWLLLFDLAKFDKQAEVGISIDKLQDLLGYRSRRSIEMNLKQLIDNKFIIRLNHYSNIGKQMINTYKVLLPKKLLTILENSNKKVSIKPKSPKESIVPEIEKVGIDYAIQINESPEVELSDDSSLNPDNSIIPAPSPAKNCGPFNYPRNMDINNCYTSNLDNVDKENLHVFYPAKEKPISMGRVVLRHCLDKVTIFEKKLGQFLTEKQEALVSKIIAFWTRSRYISAPKEAFEWITNALLNPKEYSQCGKDFLKKINTIFKAIREKRFTKPFTLRYQARERFRAIQNENELKNASEAGTHKICSHQSPDVAEGRMSAEIEDKASLLTKCRQTIANLEEKLANLGQNEEGERKTYVQLLEMYAFKLQELQYA